MMPLMREARLRVSQGPRTRNEVERGRGGGLARWGWRALAAQGLGDLRLPDPDKDRHCAAGRRPHRPGPERPTCSNKGSTFAAADAALHRPSGAGCGWL